MFAYLVIFLLFVSWSYVTCPRYVEESIPSVTTDNFDTLYNCEKICKDPQRAALVKDICVELGKKVKNAYSEERIRNNSGCKNLQVRLFSKNFGEVVVPKEIGICYLSAGDDDKCISMGREADDLLVWSRIRVELDEQQFNGVVCDPKKNLKGYWKNKLQSEPTTDHLEEGSTSASASVINESPKGCCNQQ